MHLRREMRQRLTGDTAGGVTTGGDRGCHVRQPRREDAMAGEEGSEPMAGEAET